MRGVAALLMVALAGCATAPPESRRQDMEFVRGCWVAKDAPGGKVTAFLRLLPPYPTASAYQGHVQQVTDGQTVDTMFISFARDGTEAFTEANGVDGPYFGDPPDTPVLEDGTRRAMFIGLQKGFGLLIAYGRADRLTIAIRDGGDQRSPSKASASGVTRLVTGF